MCETEYRLGSATHEEPMSSQPRQPGGTRAGGRFAATTRSEATVILRDSFRLSDPNHVEKAKDAVIEQWIYGNDSTEAALDAIEDMCWRTSLDRPNRLDVLFSDQLSDTVQNRWPADEPDEIEVGSLDLIGNVGPTWKGVGFSPAEATRWGNTGVSRPTCARRLADAGVTEEGARKIFSDTGGYVVTVGEAANNGTVTAEQASEFVAGTGHPNSLDLGGADAVGF